jgi:hypothetical protein
MRRGLRIFQIFMMPRGYGAIPIAIPTPMITSDTKTTARSIVSHAGLRLVGCSFTARILHIPHLGEKARAVMSYFTAWCEGAGIGRAIAPDCRRFTLCPPPTPLHRLRASRQR